MPIFNLPPEFQEQIEKQMDMRNMAHEEVVGRVNRFMDGLDDEQLSVFSIILHSFSHSGGRNAATFYHGIVSHMMRIKGICEQCGSTSCEHGRDDLSSLLKERDGELEPPKTLDELNAEYYKNLVKYQLREAHDGEKLICTGCGREYQNLDDRMLREPGPEGCEGCIQKAKWG